MRSLFRYLLRNYVLFLFIVLEIISFVLIFNYNDFQKVKYLNSSNRITASIYNSFNSVINYFELARVNTELATENAELRTVLKSQPQFKNIPDSLFSSLVGSDSTYRFVSARVINNSVNKAFNYITLNKGREDGIQPDQGIISFEGIVGVVTNVSKSYSLGLSVLNQRWGVSAKLKKSGFFGSLLWDGYDFRYANLMEIPFHVVLATGDTVVTSGYSSIFPEGIIVGTIESFEQPPGENYYDIKVKLSTNFKALSYVEVIQNLDKEEINELENIADDQGAN
jgi:rod shape-determining protein MreC